MNLKQLVREEITAAKIWETINDTDPAKIDANYAYLVAAARLTSHPNYTWPKYRRIVLEIERQG